MRIKPLNEKVRKALTRWNLEKPFEKQKNLFEVDPTRPSLNTEKLEPKSIGLYSFRINRKYRAVFRIRANEAEIVHITKHYQK